MHESELDREARQWLIPAERTKNGREHAVPLTNQMLSIIGESPSAPGFIFTASSATGHSTGTGVLQALKRHCVRLEIKNVGTHTLRRTFITRLAGLGVPPELRNRLTNHADQSVDARHYNAYDYLNDKRQVLEMWFETLAGIVKRNSDSMSTVTAPNSEAGEP